MVISHPWLQTGNQNITETLIASAFRFYSSFGRKKHTLWVLTIYFWIQSFLRQPCIVENYSQQKKQVVHYLVSQNGVRLNINPYSQVWHHHDAITYRITGNLTLTRIKVYICLETHTFIFLGVLRCVRMPTKIMMIIIAFLLFLLGLQFFNANTSRGTVF